MSLELVLEVLCEQMPVRAMEIALEYVKRSICGHFLKLGIESNESNTFVTPNRITFIAKGVKIERTEEKKEVKGPRVLCEEKALEGFLRKVGKQSVKELEVRNVDGVEFYYYVHSTINDGNLSTSVTEVLQEMLHEFPLHKKMRWGNSIGEWVRPVLNLACVLGREVLPISLAGSIANNTTYGNLRRSRIPYKICGVDGYLSFLSHNNVILDQDERRKKILEYLDVLISGSDLKYKRDDSIIDELNGMLENPKVLIGSVEEEFQCLPREVVSCVITKHQRCLALYDSDGRIVKFATVASVINDRVIKTHEMVLRARLSDAMFLIEKDQQKGLDRYITELSKIVFKRDLGTVLDKVNRIAALAKYTALWVPRANVLSVERAARLAKADLATLMVKEFPELQGTMGKYYAQQNGEDGDVCNAIEEHYLPSSTNTKCPSSPVVVAVSIADKVDHLVGLLATEKVTGSRDPYALRRTAISLIKVIKESGISIPLDMIVSKSVYFYLCDAKKNHELKSVFQKADVDNITTMVLEFCYERLKIILSEEGLSKDVINIVVGAYHDILIVKQKVSMVGGYLKTENGKVVLSSYRRIRKILTCDEQDKKKLSRFRNRCSEKLCDHECEIALFRKAKEKESLINSLLKSNSFTEAMDALLGLSGVVNNFLERVRIHDADNAELKKNRMLLALWVVSIYNSVLDFSKIQKEV